MPFYGHSFIFDDVPSEIYNLYLGNTNDSGESITTGSNDVVPLTQKLFRRPTLMYYGSEQSPTLSFPLFAYCPSELTAPDYSLVAKWLFGQQSYKKLIICQEDMSDIYFNVFLTAPNITRVGNLIQSFTATVQCDSPWGFRESKTYTYTFGDGYTISEDIIFLNESDNAFYTFPTSLIITTNIFGGICEIVNHTDDDRAFILGTVTNPLLPQEVITMNPDQQLISSNKVADPYPISKFNSNFLRFLPGLNLLTISGNISSISLTVPVAVKVG
jgi:hypothetical protein